MKLPPPETISETVRRALQEDIGAGDVTAQLIEPGSLSSARIISRQQAVMCGAPWVDEVFRQLDERVSVTWQFNDGDSVDVDQVLCRLQGPSRALLAGERSALNFLQTLSGTATRARQYAEAVAGTRAQVLDTRKTIPGLRDAQKYAVRCGGCYNHRMGLYDAILIKENHIQAAGSLENAIALARQAQAGEIPLELEVENLDQLERAIKAGAPRLLLDNMNLEELVQAVQLNQGRARLEASGGVTLDNIRAIAQTGVDYISVGDLTKDVIAVDLSMRFEH